MINLLISDKIGHTSSDRRGCELKHKKCAEAHNHNANEKVSPHAKFVIEDQYFEQTLAFSLLQHHRLRLAI